MRRTVPNKDPDQRSDQRYEPAEEGGRLDERVEQGRNASPDRSGEGLEDVDSAHPDGPLKGDTSGDRGRGKNINHYT